MPRGPSETCAAKIATSQSGKVIGPPGDSKRDETFLCLVQNSLSDLADEHDDGKS